jgi:hypothetical protein
MAGGIDWFRWHHGSVTDPKFQLVARKAKASLPDVLAVWVFVLESASASAHRGEFEGIDCEAVDCLFGFDDGTTAAILAQMETRGLIEGCRVSSWEKRQPKREDGTAANRKRSQRERELAQKMANAVTPEMSHDVTPRHADVTQCHDREEESREELIKEANASSSAEPPDYEPDGEPESEDGDEAGSKVPKCPAVELIDSYEERLPQLPPVRRSLFLAGKNMPAMRQRWKWVMTSCHERGERKGQRLATTVEEGVAWFDRYFAYVAESKFLTGEKGDFRANLPWLVNASNFEKVLNGNYHREDAA